MKKLLGVMCVAFVSSLTLGCSEPAPAPAPAPATETAPAQPGEGAEKAAEEKPAETPAAKPEGGSTAN